MNRSDKAPSQQDLELLNAYVDGELDPVNAMEMQRRLSGNAELAAEHGRLLALRGALQSRLRRPIPPADLEARIRRKAGHPAAPSFGLRSLAASVVIAALLAGGLTWREAQNRGRLTLRDAIVDSHVRGLMAQPIDVASSETHTVKPWFNGRVPMAPRLVDLAATGFTLLGGRVDVVSGDPVATVVYQRRKHIISVYALTPGTLSLKSEEAVRGFNLVEWEEQGAQYLAISDLNQAELTEFAERFRGRR